MRITNESGTTFRRFCWMEVVQVLWWYFNKYCVVHTERQDIGGLEVLQTAGLHSEAAFS